MIPIDHLHDHPFAPPIGRGGFVLILGIHHAYCPVWRFKLDNVIANVMRGTGELLPQGVIHPLFEMRATHFVPPDFHVLREQVDQCVQITHIQRQGVLRRQLANRIQRFEAIYPR